MPDLKPCPFCGSENLALNGYPTKDRVECNRCIGTWTPCGPAKGEDVCTTAWNHRPAEDAQKAEIDRLNGLLDERDETISDWIADMAELDGGAVFWKRTDREMATLIRYKHLDDLLERDAVLLAKRKEGTK